MVLQDPLQDLLHTDTDTNTDKYIIVFYRTTTLCPKTIQLMLSEDQSIVVEF